jgi:hypothetical protein
MRKKKSAILEAVHDTAKGLHKAGVMDQVTLREFDRLCLMPLESLEPEKIRQIREESNVSHNLGSPTLPLDSLILSLPIQHIIIILRSISICIFDLLNIPKSIVFSMLSKNTNGIKVFSLIFGN